MRSLFRLLQSQYSLPWGALGLVHASLKRQRGLDIRLEVPESITDSISRDEQLMLRNA
jgi:hypothetical protein